MMAKKSVNWIKLEIQDPPVLLEYKRLEIIKSAPPFGTLLG
jgi:hypothetical protein